MEQDIYTVIEEKRSEMSKSFNAIADFILLMRERTLLYSASKLASHVGVSNATIIRFSQFLGFSGYDELKRMLVASTDPNGGLPGDFTYPIHELGSEQEYIQIAFQYEMTCLNKVIQDFSYNKVADTVNAIEKARRVFFLGLGSSAVPAYSLYFSFDRLQLNCTLLDFGGYHVIEKLTFVSQQDVLVAVTFPRYSIDTYNAIKQAKSGGACVILISDGGSPLLSELADIEFTVPSKNPFLMYNSNIGATALCNILVLEYCYRHYESCSKILKRITDNTTEYRIKSNGR